MDLPDFTKPSSIILDRVLTNDELAQFPKDAQALPMPGPDGRWSHTYYAVQWGLPIVPILAHSLLGQNGQFGNQLFQYAFTRLFAEKLQRGACVPKWAGSTLFALDDPPVVQVYPHHRDLTHKWDESQLNVYAADIPPCLDISGYFQFHTSYYAPHKERIREWFSPTAEIEARFGTAMVAMVGHRTLVCLQLRRGAGYGKGMFFITPDGVYLDWLATIWPTLENPVLYIATDDPAVVSAYAAFNPLTSADMGVSVQGFEFFTDFYVLMHARMLAISNSTFGVWAAMLNRFYDHAGLDDGMDYVRPRYSLTKLQPFDPWNCDPLTDRDQDRPEVTVPEFASDRPRQVFGGIAYG